MLKNLKTILTDVEEAEKNVLLLKYKSEDADIIKGVRASSNRIMECFDIALEEIRYLRSKKLFDLAVALVLLAINIYLSIHFAGRVFNIIFIILLNALFITVLIETFLSIVRYNEAKEIINTSKKIVERNKGIELMFKTMQRMQLPLGIVVNIEVDPENELKKQIVKAIREGA